MPCSVSSTVVTEATASTAITSVAREARSTALKMSDGDATSETRREATSLADATPVARAVALPPWSVWFAWDEPEPEGRAERDAVSDREPISRLSATETAVGAPGETRPEPPSGRLKPIGVAEGAPKPLPPPLVPADGVPDGVPVKPVPEREILSSLRAFHA